jgi:hypothetical protein
MPSVQQMPMRRLLNTTKSTCRFWRPNDRDNLLNDMVLNQKFQLFDLLVIPIDFSPDFARWAVQSKLARKERDTNVT